MGVALFDREARSLVQRLRLWTPPRWSADVRPGLTRADLAHHLVQAVAALDPAGTGAVPRLVGDLVLPDQLAVVAHDLVRSAPAPEVAARATAHLLLHRLDLLGDDVPSGLAADLGAHLGATGLTSQDVLTLGRRACRLDPGLGPDDDGPAPAQAGTGPSAGRD